jgi:hypothetical protein
MQFLALIPRSGSQKNSVRQNFMIAYSGSGDITNYEKIRWLPPMAMTRSLITSFPYLATLGGLAVLGWLVGLFRPMPGPADDLLED